MSERASLSASRVSGGQFSYSNGRPLSALLTPNKHSPVERHDIVKRRWKSCPWTPSLVSRARLQACVLASVTLLTCSCFQISENSSTGTPKLAGTWAILNDDFGGLFSVVTFDETGVPLYMCHQLDFAEQGIDLVILDGSPHASSGGLVTTASMRVTESDDTIIAIQQISVGVAGIELASATSAMGVTLTSDEEASGFLVIDFVSPSDHFIGVRPVLVKRLSESFESCVTDDAFEPNNTPETAVTLLPGDYPLLQSLDEDWYRVDVPQGQIMNARIEFDSDMNDLNLLLYDAAGVDSLDASTANGRNVQTVSSPTGPGTFLLLVEEQLVNPQYELVLEFSADPDDALEDNDTMETATVIGNGTFGPSTVTVDAVAIDDDWYHVHFVGPSNITVSVTFENAAGDIDVDLFDSSGLLLGSSTSTSNRETLSDGTLDGGFFVRVYLYDGDLSPYLMEVSQEAAPLFNACAGALMDCSGENTEPGCGDERCCVLVCRENPVCCTTEWNGDCVTVAAATCFP